MLGFMEGFLLSISCSNWLGFITWAITWVITWAIVGEKAQSILLLFLHRMISISWSFTQSLDFNLKPLRRCNRKSSSFVSLFKSPQRRNLDLFDPSRIYQAQNGEHYLQDRLCSNLIPYFKKSPSYVYLEQTSKHFCMKEKL